jgi:uncharacterized protein YdeI (BOF family)
MTMSNLWQKNKKRLVRELIKQYKDEGYDHRLAKKMAIEEAEELSDSDEAFLRGIFNAQYGDNE